MTKKNLWMKWVLEESAQTPNLLARNRQARAAASAGLRADTAKFAETKAA